MHTERKEPLSKSKCRQSGMLSNCAIVWSFISRSSTFLKRSQNSNKVEKNEHIHIEYSNTSPNHSQHYLRLFHFQSVCVGFPQHIRGLHYVRSTLFPTYCILQCLCIIRYANCWNKYTVFFAQYKHAHTYQYRSNSRISQVVSRLAVRRKKQTKCNFLSKPFRYVHSNYISLMVMVVAATYSSACNEPLNYFIGLIFFCPFSTSSLSMQL